MKYELNGNTGITCKSEELVERLQSRFKELPECENILRDGASWVDTWKICKEETVFFPCNGTYNSTYNAENYGYTIIDGEDWLRSFDDEKKDELIEGNCAGCGIPFRHDPLFCDGCIPQPEGSEGYFNDVCKSQLPGLITKEQRQQIYDICNSARTNNLIARKVCDILDGVEKPKEDPKPKEYMTPLQSMRWYCRQKDIVYRVKNDPCKVYTCFDFDLEIDQISELEFTHNIPENEINNGTELTNWREFLVEYLK